MSEFGAHYLDPSTFAARTWEKRSRFRGANDPLRLVCRRGSSSSPSKDFGPYGGFHFGPFRARMPKRNIALPTDGEAGAPNSLVALVR